ncbi:aryl-alcohol dehydrogenase-like predicted oxidoreductase [Sphingomonas jejuensis]|uniref:Aryl-alcohol dehydrogenase-like predicted oxidoreductase n=1 Tax=Sphingomonas jejuensis TaxID=904715 RepID=A0ABX0XPL9_9SPHN|nr:aldo/keto reductase [Sphingomonas jejuensis]NJC34610.1 aryl-alcohol dehydrogenase-like predicted oxidoreductase [Sphingomonas jejuensis]
MSEARRLGPSGLSIPPLVLGGNVFGWTADRETSFAVLDAFVDGGGRMIDTADVYSAWVDGHSGGESETIIGEWLRVSGKRDHVLIATKVGMLPGEGGDGLAPERIAAACEASLKRLGVERIDLYYAHRDHDAVPQHDMLAAFDDLAHAGKIATLGLSNFSATRLTSAIDVAERDGLIRPSVLQPEYNLISRAFERELQPLCVARDVAVLPYYGLASGFLTGKYRSPEDATGARGGKARAALEAGGLEVLAVMDEVAEETGATLAQIALAWLMAQPAVVAPIASATSVAQVGDLLGSLQVELTRSQIERLSAASGDGA